MPAGNCVISFINEDAEGEHGVSCSAAELGGAGMQSSAAALGQPASTAWPTAPRAILLSSDPTQKSQNPGKTLML